MRDRQRPVMRLRRRLVGGIALVAWSCATLSWGDRVELLDGRVLDGRFARLPGVAIDPVEAARRDFSPSEPILMCDDELARTMVSKRQVRAVEEAVVPDEVEGQVRQRLAHPDLGGGAAHRADGRPRRNSATTRRQQPKGKSRGVTPTTPTWAGGMSPWGRAPSGPQPTSANRGRLASSRGMSVRCTVDSRRVEGAILYTCMNVCKMAA